MRTAIISVITSIFTAIVVFVVMNTIMHRKEDKIIKEKLIFTEQCVKKSLDNVYLSIQEQLTNFADLIASDRDFSISIFVENNSSSPTITQMAPNFIKPMGFSFLEIVDSLGVILSCGNFPASAGNSIKEKLASLSEEVTVYKDNIKGKPMLTLQARKSFKIADFKFYVMGGFLLDERLLKILLPGKNVLLILKHGSEYVATENIGSVSSVKNNIVIINDKEYPASEIALPVAEKNDSFSLLVVLKIPLKK